MAVQLLLDSLPLSNEASQGGRLQLVHNCHHWPGFELGPCGLNPAVPKLFQWAAPLTYWAIGHGFIV